MIGGLAGGVAAALVAAVVASPPAQPPGPVVRWRPVPQVEPRPPAADGGGPIVPIPPAAGPAIVEPLAPG